MMFPQNGISISQIDSYLANNYLFWNGMPYFNYKEDRNWQVNPYQVAYIASYYLNATVRLDLNTIWTALFSCDLG